MARYFFDTRALAKRYIQETGSTWVSEVLEDTAADPVFIAELTEVEMIAAICRRSKGGSLTLVASKTAIRDFDDDLSNQYVSVEITSGIITDARRFAELYALRGYDAVQLAAAVACEQEQDGQPELPAFIFVTSEAELIAAANSESLSVENPNNYP